MLNYDPYGCKQLYLLIYYVGQNFSDFWAKLAIVSFEHLQERFGSVILIKNPVDINLNNSDIILFDVTLNGRRVELYYDILNTPANRNMREKGMQAIKSLFKETMVRNDNREYFSKNDVLVENYNFVCQVIELLENYRNKPVLKK